VTLKNRLRAFVRYTLLGIEPPPNINIEALADTFNQTAQQTVLKALSPDNDEDPSRPNMSALAESLRDLSLLKTNIKVLSWKLSQIERREILDEHPDWRKQRTIQEIVRKFENEFQPTSRPCCGNDIYSGWHFGLTWLMGGQPLTRKAWEWTFTIQCLWNLGILNRDSPAAGLGFGCGTEPLVSLLANFNVALLATDLSPESELAKCWSETDQNTGCLDQLYKSQLVSKSDFISRVSYRDLDMTNIPLDELEGKFEFAWSSCALEHLGSKQKGFDFILNAGHCLKPGGIAIHTTEFDHTGLSQIDNWPTVMYTQADIIELKKQLAAHGMELVSPSFQQSGHFIDGYIDIPPYPYSAGFDPFFKHEGSPSPDTIPQINLSIDGYKATSYALIVQRH